MNRMKIKYLAFVSCLLLLSFTACVDIDIKTKINADGSGTQSWKLTTTALLASQIREQVERDPFFNKKGKKTSEEFKEGDYTLSIDLPFQDIKELKDKGHDSFLEKTGLIRKTYNYSETWTPQFGADSALLKRRASSFFPVTLKFSVELPGKIIESNADHLEGNVASWNIPLSDLTQSKSLRAKSVRWNLALIIPLALILIFAFFALALLVILRRKRTPTVLPAAMMDCPNCHKSIPSGSAFCNFCGGKI